MSVNISRFEGDVKRLVEEARELEFVMLLTVHGDEMKAAMKKAKPERLQELEKRKGTFKADYEVWYSEALVFLKQLLPDRLADFVGHYEIPRGRKDISFTNYKMQDYLQGTRVTRGYNEDVVVDRRAAIPQFQSQAAILKAAQARFRSSLFEIRQLVQADLFDSEVEAARELAKSKFLRAAGAVAGVVLEKHLQQVCDDHSIKITKKHPGIGDLNELLKSNGVIDIPQWRHISLLGDIRNLCDHNKQKEPTAAQIDDLLDGTDKVIKTIS